MDSIKLLFYGRVSNGELVYDGAHLHDYQSQLPMYEGKHVRVTVEAFREKTDAQQAYYFGIVLPCVVEGFTAMGNTVINHKNKAHIAMRSVFLTYPVVDEETGEVMKHPRTGEDMVYCKSTSELSRQEMAAYIDEIIRFCAEDLQVQVPEPDRDYRKKSGPRIRRHGPS